MADTQTDTKTCPFCGETILAVAIKCKYCREFLDGPRPAHSEAPARKVEDVIPADDRPPEKVVKRQHYPASTFRKLHAWYVFGHAVANFLLLFGVAIMITAVCLGAIRSYDDRLAMWLGAGIGTIMLTLAPAIIGAVAFMMLLYKSWNMIQDGHARTDAFKAVMFLFVPYFNYYWIFVAIRGLTVNMNAYIQRHGLSVRPASVRIATLYCIVLITGLVPILGLLSLLFVQCVLVFLIGGTIARTAAAIADAESGEPAKPRFRFPWAAVAAAFVCLLFVATVGLGMYFTWPAHAAHAVALPAQDPLCPGQEDDCLAMSADGKTVLGGCKGGGSWTLNVWDRSDVDAGVPHKPRRTLQISTSYGQKVAFALSPNGQTLAVVKQHDVGMRDENYSGQLTLWDLQSGKERLTKSAGSPGDDGAVDCAAFSPNGSWMATGWIDGDPNQFPPRHQIRIRNALSGEVQETLDGHTAEITGLAFSGDSRLLVSGSRDGTVKVWDIHTLPNHERFSFQVSQNTLVRVAFCPTSQQVAACEGRAVQVWDANSGQAIMGPPSADDTAQIAFSKNGAFLAIGGRNVQIWNIKTQQVVLTLERGFFTANTRPFDVLQFSSDGKRLIAAAGRDIWIWDFDL